MRLLFFTDSHIRATSPKSRKDDFFETILEKLDEILHEAVVRGAKAIIHGGDLFDRPDPSLVVVTEVAKRIMACPVPFYVVCGNHDIYGHNPETISRSMLGFLAAMNVVKLLDESPVILEEGGMKVQLTGAPYTYEIDQHENASRNSYILRERQEDVDVAIHVAHGFLVKDPVHPQIFHTLVEDIARDTLADITLSGHFHYGFEKTYYEGKIFFNPGAIARISNSKKELGRMPQYVVITLEKDQEPQLETVVLTCAKPGEEVLDRIEMENHRFKQEKLQEFREGLQTTQVFQGTNVDALIATIQAEQKTPQEVVNEARARIDAVRLERKDDVWRP